jgi:hypothetical protein
MSGVWGEVWLDCIYSAQELGDAPEIQLRTEEAGFSEVYQSNMRMRRKVANTTRKTADNILFQYSYLSNNM